MIWLSVLLEFEQLANTSDRCERWCSFRSSNWMLAYLCSPEEKADFISDLLQHFLADVEIDFYDMTAQQSGWSFVKIVQFDVKYITRDINNAVTRFGNGQKPLIFHPALTIMFRGSVVDSSSYLAMRQDKESLCVPASCLLILYKRLSFQYMKNIVKAQFVTEIDFFYYKELLKNRIRGICVDDLSKFETLNQSISPELLSRFPALALFRGFAVNIFIVRKCGQEFRLFPLSLSRNARDSSFLQLDLLAVSKDILFNPEKQSWSSQHVLAILDLAHFVAKFKNVRYTRYKYVCRSCLELFTSNLAKRSHSETCDHRARNHIGRRKSKNVLIHRTFRLNKFSGKIERQGLFFSRNSYFKLLRPLSIAFLDFESYNRPVELTGQSVIGRAPAQAISKQYPMSWALVHYPLYDQIPLPTSLESVRIKFLNTASETDTKDFFISLLLQLRKDIVLQSQYLSQTLSYDAPPPAYNLRTEEQKDLFLKTKFCFLCGIRFGSLKPGKNGKMFKVNKNFDHNHFSNRAKGTFGLQNSQELRAILCSGTKVFYWKREIKHIETS